MAGLLALSGLATAFPSRGVRKSDIKVAANQEITAAGTAPVLHRIPYSSLKYEPISEAKIENISGKCERPLDNYQQFFKQY